MKKLIIVFPVIIIVIILIFSNVFFYDELEIPDYVKNTLERNVEDGFYNGVIIGTVTPYTTNYFSIGKMSENSQQITENTKFEIASLSKIFTALLLTDLLDQKKLSLDDELGNYFTGEQIDESVKTITIIQLATHTSGLPRLPINETKTWEKFYTSFDEKQLDNFLNNYSKNSTNFFYSNLGYTILGEIIEKEVETTYEEEVKSKILEPLEMNSTDVTRPDSKYDLLATGYKNGKPIENKGWMAPLGSGGYHSSAKDMLHLLEAYIGSRNTNSLNLELTLEPRHEISKRFDREQSIQSIGWKLLKCGETEVYWHDGGTDGFRSFMGFDPNSKTGVVVLSNSETDVEHIGFHILNNQTFNMREFNITELSTEQIDIVGKYNFTKNSSLEITRDEDKIFAKLNNESKLQIYPESDLVFFFTDTYSSIKFEKNEFGVIDTAVLYKNSHGEDRTMNFCPNRTGNVAEKIT